MGNYRQEVGLILKTVRRLQTRGFAARLHTFFPLGVVMLLCLNI
jgi:hypothetical protein